MNTKHSPAVEANILPETVLESRPTGVALPVITGGLAMTVGVWCLWWLLHTPALSAPRAVSGPVLVAAMVGFAALACRWRGQQTTAERMKFGGLIGLVSGLLNLMILGSMLTQPASDAATAAQSAANPANVQQGIASLESSTVLIMGCFVILCGLLGVVGGVISTLLPAAAPADQASQTARHWLGRLGLVVAIAVLPLLLLGGLVTSANAGLSVPDWPGTFGSNMFLYPVSLMDSADPRIFKEHTHRLFGALVGVATLLQMVMIFRHESRKGVVVWGIIAFLLVCIQGALGGAWVVTVSKFLPVFHGVLGQIFFASMVALAIVLSPRFVSSERAALPSKGRVILPITLLALALQLSFGATYRHLRGQPGASHALLSHIVFSVVAFGLVVAGGIIAIKVGKALAERDAGPVDGREASGSKTTLGDHIRVMGIWLHGVVSLQFVLGWIAWAVIATTGKELRYSPGADELATTPQEAVLSVTVRTLHQANGAILLALTAGLAVWLWRITRPVASVASADLSIAGRTADAVQ